MSALEHRLEPPDTADYADVAALFIRRHRVEIDDVLRDLASLDSHAKDAGLDDYFEWAGGNVRELVTVALPSFRKGDSVKKYFKAIKK